MGIAWLPQFETVKPIKMETDVRRKYFETT